MNLHVKESIKKLNLKEFFSHYIGIKCGENS